jgi:Protein of unknown function (DUF2865)
MTNESGKRSLFAAAVFCYALSLPVGARAEDFLSTLFRAFNARPPAPPIAMPYDRYGPQGRPMRERVSRGDGQAFCVRTCDGRYFPITGSDNASKAASCNSFCPAAETKLVYGSSIDDAATDDGKSYSELPNAFRYRNEIVSGCTCNGKDQFGLAPVSIEKDPTLRKGDIVAGANGLVVAEPGSGKRASLNFSPMPKSVRDKFRQVPVVARE